MALQPTSTVVVKQGLAPRRYGAVLPWMPGTLVGALSAVMVGVNEPTFCFSVGVKVAGDCEALLPVGALVSTGLSLVSLPQAVMVAIPARAAAAANRATLLLKRVVFTTYLLKLARKGAYWRELYRVGFGSPG